jgi:hypothetical protein
MSFSEFEHQAMRTAKQGGFEFDLTHAALGLSGIVAGCLFGKYILAKSVIWLIERKWGKHYRIKFKDYDGASSVIHIWTKDDMQETYALMIQEVHNIIAKGVEEKIAKFERVGE